MQRQALQKQIQPQTRQKPALQLVVTDGAEARRREIARQAEEACNLPGNVNGPDLDQFGCDFA